MKIQQDSSCVSAADIVRSFAACRDRAVSAPLFITNHGRNSHVLLGIEQFQQLTASAGSSPAEPQGDNLRELADWMDDAVIIADHELSIIFANRVAHAICHRPAGSLMGKALITALPELGGSLLEVHARRTQVSSEPSAADLPSPFSKDAWLRFQTFPIGDKVILIFRDISEEVSRHRLADVKEALLQAMDAHGGIGYVRVSLRATIERVDQPFCNLIGLPEDKLVHLPIADLVPVACRPEFREKLEGAIRGAPAQRLETTLLSNTEGMTDVVVSLSSLHGAYGAEGAVLLVTRNLPTASLGSVRANAPPVRIG